MTRRDFLLRLRTLGAVGLALVACVRPSSSSGPQGETSASPTTAPQPSSTPTESLSPAASPMPSPTATTTPARVPVAMVHGTDVDTIVARAVEMAGGLVGLKPGATVLIKPNVNSDDPYPSTTNPAVVRAVVETVRRLNPGRIVVADRSEASYNTMQAMQKTGIYQEALDAGAEVLALENEEWVQVKPRGASYWPSLRVPRLLMDADYVISVPVAHTHFLAGYSMALKNWVGMIHPGNRNVMHSSQPSYSPSLTSSPPMQVVHHYGVRAAEANIPRRADFVVIDATRAYIAGGPYKGAPARPDIVIASRDPIAADAAGLALLTHFGAWDAVSGISVWQQPQISQAVELGLGVKGSHEIELLDEDVQNIEDIKALMV